MNDIKKSKNISGEAYIQSSNANVHVLLNLSIFWLVFIIHGELVLDNCIYALPERFLDFLQRNTNLPIGSLYKVPHISPPFLFYDVITDKAHSKIL